MLEDAMSITVMKQALEALTRIWEDGLENFPESGHDAAITALRTAIEQAEKQEPVAWMDASETALSWENYLDGMKPLYTAPPAAQRQPLTDDRIGQIIEQCKITLVNYCSGEKQTEFARAIEAAQGIKETNT
jgi:hypothetical protein